MEKWLRKNIYIVLLVFCLTLSACGRSDETVNSTGDIEDIESDTKTEGDMSSEKNSADNIEDNTIEKTKETKEEIEEAVIDGFYNCIESEEPCVKIKFEIKTTGEGLKALFYSQYTVVDLYEPGPVLEGKSLSDNTYEFYSEDESYTVTWDGGDFLSITGTCHNGRFGRGDKESEQEGTYIIDEIPKYEPDKNVEEGIEIDSAFAGVIRTELGHDENQILTYEDLRSVTYLLVCGEPIPSLNGVSLLENLDEIHIDSSCISDISELGKLKNIRVIDISNAYVKKIPDLSGCSNLESLYLTGNMIEDVSPVADILTLRTVELSNNLIKSIEPLKNAVNLEMLCIENNCILDYGSIADCENLIKAYNEGAQATYEEALALENTVKEIVSSFPDNMSELETEITVYKYIMDNMYYNEANHISNSYGYRGIVEGSGVCGDYADAFCLLASHAGLEVYNCESSEHAWNIVQIGGKYYHCDVLWDDDSDVWTYFNRSTGFIYNVEYHQHDLNKYPICEESMSLLDYYQYMDRE